MLQKRVEGQLFPSVIMEHGVRFVGQGFQVVCPPLRRFLTARLKLGSGYGNFPGQSGLSERHGLPRKSTQTSQGVAE